MNSFLQEWWSHLTTAAAAVIAILIGLLDAWHFHAFPAFDLPAITFGIGLLAGVAPPTIAGIAATTNATTSTNPAP